jgi:hypothetical protein
MVVHTVIPATQEVELGGWRLDAGPGSGIRPSLKLGTCNPSYSGGRDEKHHSSKPAGILRPYLEKTHHKKGLVEWLKV